MRPALLDRRAERRAAPEQVLLAHELAERPRPHPRRERLAGGLGGRRTRRGLLHLEQAFLHSGKSGKEARKRLAHSRGRLVPDEVAGPVHHDQLRVRQLPLEAVGAGHGGELVTLAPDEQDGDVQRPRGRIPRASRSRRSGTGRGGCLRRVASAYAFQYSSSASSLTPAIDWRTHAREVVRSIAPIICSPVCGSRSAFAMPCHLPSGKKPVELITSALTRVRVLARPAQPDQAAPVVHDRHAALDAELAPEALERLHVALPGAGRVGRRIAETREVGRDRAPAGVRDSRHHAVPHERRLRVAVQEERHRRRPQDRFRGRRVRRRASNLGA